MSQAGYKVKGSEEKAPAYPVDPRFIRNWSARAQPPSSKAFALQRNGPRPGVLYKASPDTLVSNPMCNRYAADIRKAGKERDYYGFDEWSETRINPMLGNAVLEVFPKSTAPVLKPDEAGRLWWTTMRWGLPGPKQFGGAPVTNIRNIKSPHWRPLLGPQHRCLVPFTAFSEYEDASPKGKKQIRWFAPPDRTMLFFAGISGEWYGDYGSKKAPNVGVHKLFSFLTTAANDLVRPVHAKAMPVILRTQAEREEWLNAPADQIQPIQARALPTNALEILSEDEAAQYVGGYLK